MFGRTARKARRQRYVIALDRAAIALNTIDRSIRRIHPENLTPQDATEIRRLLIESAQVTADILEIMRDALMDGDDVRYGYPQCRHSDLD